MDKTLLFIIFFSVIILYVLQCKYNPNSRNVGTFFKFEYNEN